MNREAIRNRAVIHYRPPLTRVFVKAVSYLAAYIDNNEHLWHTREVHKYVELLPTTGPMSPHIDWAPQVNKDIIIWL